MSMMTIDPETMPVDKKLELIGLLWDSIKRKSFKVPDWHKDELKRRREWHKANPGAGRPWSEIERDLLGK